MTTAVDEAETTLSLVTQEQRVSTLKVTGENGKTEEGQEPRSATSDVPSVTQLLRRWEPLATTVSISAVPPSSSVTPAVQGL